MEEAFRKELERIIAAALAEDVGTGDVTSQLTVPAEKQAEMHFVAREDMVACGLFVPEAVFAALDTSVKLQVSIKEGTFVAKNTVLVTASGPARTLLTGERVALNLMQRLSGVASVTRRFVQAVAGTRAVILDTRKTMPGLRALDKYAVRMGGGQNYRMGLYDMVMIKDNHIAVCGGISQAIARVRAGSKLPVEVECDTLEQVHEALRAKPDTILLDNMTLDELRQAVRMNAGAVKLEASGGIGLDNVRSVAETGVDYISVGKLTHSAPAVDIAGDITLKTPS